MHYLLLFSDEVIFSLVVIVTRFLFCASLFTKQFVKH